ncbi:hypothetical protein KHQ08_02385 [Pseudochrobactrum algeriensis]|uniref:hypothetical protein n=1 Tax=Pseudochrobactrum algeriensis TaxID=2834768 RepID=UPI001BCCE1BD|nr:hypothetical protein [Pseudochrobactrum algeriensis]MBX8813205.1 hypothetical protein [Ochrobactrum sp. MR34]QVQ36963.1 hypothetical protein KHQ08_02385 [Pseudochrobactrum algeriensis]QVQ40179.1 hypothetical protein KHQ07_00680 [Pseudochrobactrum algeriensis]QVQ44102.1 hypothetical protein KHQ09_02655 [Pseudochrobactrum algeriensis]
MSNKIIIALGSAQKLLSSGDKWTDTTTRLLLPVVIKSALDGDTIQYGEFNKFLREKNKPTVLPIAFRNVAGKIGDICEILSAELKIDIPLLNAIIVNKDSGLPSHGVDGYLKRSQGKNKKQIENLHQKDRDSYALEEINSVFSFEEWRYIAKYLQIEISNKDEASRDRGQPLDLVDQKPCPHNPESDEHKKLKKWVSTHPEVISSFGFFEKGELEYILSSGDRVDIIFKNETSLLAVEVKARNASKAEMERGLFQCIKYRAVLRAMQLAKATPPNANSVLIIENNPSEKLKILAKRLSVKIISIRPIP